MYQYKLLPNLWEKVRRVILLDKNEILNLYNEIERKRKEMNIIESQVRKLDQEIQLETEKYRNRSVARVLEYINNKCWDDENIDDLHILMVHCLNKLNGNVDGIELSLQGE